MPRKKSLDRLIQEQLDDHVDEHTSSPHMHTSDDEWMREQENSDYEHMDDDLFVHEKPMPDLEEKYFDDYGMDTDYY